MLLAKRLINIYQVLYKAFGPQHWWPGGTPFEVMVGAILTQNTNWSNVEKAITNLKNVKVLDPKKLLKLSNEDLAELIRSTGYFNIKAKRLKNFLRYFVEKYDGSVASMKKVPLEELRAELLGVNGIGQETADSILLYALDKPIFVCDTYTYRILTRHNLACEESTYADLQAIFMDSLENDTKLFNEFHALIVRVGKNYCKPVAKCDECPLRNQ